uniref:LY6/PLAUR domain containing 6 n=1 Tax=Oryzias melastigma TaxID=30732 RepID=A0A3B3BCC8_ORYME
MKAWPTVAGILLLICEQLRTVQPRDFSMKDIILLHPSTTPHPGGFKCFTCEDAADNYQCNRWAPDVFCPKGTKYCYTLHMMDDRGGSVSVTKRCATLENCQLTGCVNVTHNGYQVNMIRDFPFLIFFQIFSLPLSDVYVLLRGEHLQHHGAEKRQQRRLLLHLSAGQLGRRPSPPRTAALHHRGLELPPLDVLESNVLT